jgi:hypothetical protein
MKRYVCDKCGKLITRDEADESCKQMRNSMSDTDSDIFDVWFWNYCQDCAQKYISQKKQGL